MNSRKATLLGLALALAAPFAMADEAHDREFLTTAIAGNLAEIELGKLAQSKGQSEQIREFGEKLVDDHENALRSARNAAEDLGIVPPRQPTPEAQQAHERLAQLSGAEFDRQFVAYMVMDHEKDVATFKVQAEHDETHSLSPATAHAKETLPALEEHLAMAQSLSASPPLR